MGPSTVFDFRGERRSGHHQVLALHADHRDPGLEFVELLLLPTSLITLEAGPDASDVIPAVTVASGKEKAGDCSRQRSRWLVADDYECVALDALDLQPIAGAT